MAHHLFTDQHPERKGDLSGLEIFNHTNRLRITAARPGRRLAVKLRPPEGRGLVANVAGEDLYALREFLLSLPEDWFTEPAPTVEVPDWEDGDIVVTTDRADFDQTWLRGKVLSGVWHPLIPADGQKDISIRGGMEAQFTDEQIEGGVTMGTVRPVRQRGEFV